jgi:Tfp pilus assembly protein PilF
MRQDKEWTLDGALAELANIDKKMPDRSFAFILGAGASVSSGIPSGIQLARRWLLDLHRCECLDGRDFEAWLADGPLGIDGLKVDNAAEFYPQIFERRFGKDKEAGYAELEDAMKDGRPGSGYSLLAEIMQTTRHKVVITTNFDNLVVDALAMHDHQSPLVVGHETLAGFARPQTRRPLIAKIHRDLFLAPQNDPRAVSQMADGWKSALKKLFQLYTPIVIGYGGNDGSLMDLLESLDEGAIAGRMIWCYRDTLPPLKAQAVLDKHDGKRLKIAGFDEFMVRLADTLIDNFDVTKIAAKLTATGKKRAEDFQEITDALLESLAQGGPVEREAGEVLAKSAKNDDDWWSWQVRADAEPDFDKRRIIYEEGLRHLPNSIDLNLQYAEYLEKYSNNLDEVENAYKRALTIDQSNSKVLMSFAEFLAQHRSELTKSDELFRIALASNPENSTMTGRYAVFTKNFLKDIVGAEALYKKALAIDPSDAIITSNYAILLGEYKKDFDLAEAMFKQALTVRPKHSGILYAYANFLAQCRKDNAAAEMMFKKAMVANPKNALALCAYGWLLAQIERPDEGHALFRRAVEINAKSMTLEYARFLYVCAKDREAADAQFLNAIKLNPNSAVAAGSYGEFLSDDENKSDKAISMFEKAIALDPNDFNSTANLASFLLTRANPEDMGRVEDLLDKAVSNRAAERTQARAEAYLYLSLYAEKNGASPSEPLKELKKHLQIGYERADWSFQRLFAICLPPLAKQRQDFYVALGNAILNESQVVELERFSEWKEIQEAERVE